MQPKVCKSVHPAEEIHHLLTSFLHSGHSCLHFFDLYLHSLDRINVQKVVQNKCNTDQSHRHAGYDHGVRRAHHDNVQNQQRNSNEKTEDQPCMLRGQHGAGEEEQLDLDRKGIVLFDLDSKASIHIKSKPLDLLLFGHITIKSRWQGEIKVMFFLFGLLFLIFLRFLWLFLLRHFHQFGETGQTHHLLWNIGRSLPFLPQR
mmetsp:Transcript_6580/g.11321  ORF Transcript_6580/g.11321 Transcript_6580/m.11321 type:complete len:202 (-) Transcript_6580:934-1539(-)